MLYYAKVRCTVLVWSVMSGCKLPCSEDACAGRQLRVNDGGRVVPSMTTRDSKERDPPESMNRDRPCPERTTIKTKTRREGSQPVARSRHPEQKKRMGGDCIVLHIADGKQQFARGEEKQGTSDKMERVFVYFSPLNFTTVCRSRQRWIHPGTRNVHGARTVH